MNYFDPSGGMGAAPPGIGVTPVASPLPQQEPNWRAILQAVLAEKAANPAAQAAAFRSAALRQDQPFYAAGSGPLGIRPGVGAGGWAMTLADSINGALGYKQQRQRDEEMLKLQKDLMEKQAKTYEALGNAVNQGSPLSPPLSY